MIHALGACMMVSYVIDERGNKSHLMNEEFAWWA